MISVKEYTAQRDEWIYVQSNTLSYKTIANHLDITESRVKQILARMRKEKKQQNTSNLN